jgi:hypothetical protein
LSSLSASAFQGLDLAGDRVDAGGRNFTHHGACGGKAACWKEHANDLAVLQSSGCYLAGRGTSGIGRFWQTLLHRGGKRGCVHELLRKKISAKPALIAAASLATSSMNASASASSALTAVSPHA